MTRTYLMARGRILRIQDGAGSVVQVHSGALWLTQEGDARDYYLGEGSALRLSGSGLALAQATRPSRVSLRATESVSAVKRPSFGMRLFRWFSLYARQASRREVQAMLS